MFMMMITAMGVMVRMMMMSGGGGFRPPPHGDIGTCEFINTHVL